MADARVTDLPEEILLHVFSYLYKPWHLEVRTSSAANDTDIFTFVLSKELIWLRVWPPNRCASWYETLFKVPTPRLSMSELLLFARKIPHFLWDIRLTFCKSRQYSFQVYLPFRGWERLFLRICHVYGDWSLVQSLVSLVPYTLSSIPGHGAARIKAWNWTPVMTSIWVSISGLVHTCLTLGIRTLFRIEE